MAVLISLSHLLMMAWDEKMGAGVVDIYLMVGRVCGGECCGRRARFCQQQYNFFKCMTPIKNCLGQCNSKGDINALSEEIYMITDTERACTLKLVP